MKKFIFFALIASMIISSCCQQTNEPIRVASYNIRMDTQSDSLNAWEYRKDKVNALIRFYDMDIIGTQEGFLHQLQDMARMTEYAYFGSGRDDGKTAGEHSAIFYRKDRFELLETGDFWLSETPDVPGKGWDATCCNRICSWGKLKEKSTGKTFYVFNVHFDHQGVVARQESGKLMIKKMQEIAKDNMIICTGDFNSHPQTEQIIALSAYLNDSKFISQAPPYGPEGTTNRRFANPLSPSRIDYIFVSEGIQVLKYASLTDNDGAYYPSDHIPVMADIILK